MERSFNLYLERQRGLDEGSLKALKASDTYWYERTCNDFLHAAEELTQKAVRTPPTSSPPHSPLFDVNSDDNGQDRGDVVAQGASLHHALYEDQVEGINHFLAADDTNLVHFQELNQEINWSSGTIDVLVRFDLFANHQGLSDYSLAKDRIADLTLMGEFTAALQDIEFEAALDGTLDVVDNPNIQQVLDQVLSPKNTSVDDMIKVIRLMDHSNDFTYYVSKVFIGW
ncbi:hypothetical protein BGW38_003088 [Lunasporangiospora selenospora]|uniref:Uncharacterized protein n=1 Tax=Lunasporangiospora selenospora TaxID=979761 RepID=A0A9P6KD37_9FUNG|nr:hypothetical protein BGW38_003088 [Lunasporangiospora selenospora]